MNVLFICASLRLNSPNKFLPVGLGSVMTYINLDGSFETDLLDIDINDYEDSYVESFLSSNAYDVYLCGSIVTHYKWMKWLTHTIRNYHPTAKIIIGNSVAGSIPELFLTHSAADVAVMGEGEITTLETLKAFRDSRSLSDIPGIAFRSSTGEIVKNGLRSASKHLDDFPFIDWSQFETERYFSKSTDAAFGASSSDSTESRFMPVSTTRGCVFRCTFCHFVFLEDPYRYRSPNSVVEEIRQNMDLYGANYFAFWDDLSFGSLRQTERMVDAILDSGLEFSWGAAVRVDLFGNPKYPYQRRLTLAKKMKDAGCVNLGYSLESGSQKILDMMEKKIKVEYFIDQVKLLDQVGISSSTSVVFGYPIESLETISETFRMALTSGVYPSIGYLLPLPQTGMYDYALKNRFIRDEDEYLNSITERQDLCINMTSMETEEILSAIKTGAEELNKSFKLGLDSGALIKTGGYDRHATKTQLDRDRGSFVAVDALERNENDFSFNYSKAVFKNERVKNDPS